MFTILIHIQDKIVDKNTKISHIPEESIPIEKIDQFINENGLNIIKIESKEDLEVLIYFAKIFIIKFCKCYLENRIRRDLDIVRESKKQLAYELISKAYGIPDIHLIEKKIASQIYYL